MSWAKIMKSAKRYTTVEMKIQRLDSGYWHIRLDANRFAQWACGSTPSEADFFGWWSERERADAIKRVTPLTTPRRGRNGNG